MNWVEKPKRRDNLKECLRGNQITYNPLTRSLVEQRDIEVVEVEIKGKGKRLPIDAKS